MNSLLRPSVKWTREQKLRDLVHVAQIMAQPLIRYTIYFEVENAIYIVEAPRSSQIQPARVFLVR